MSEPTKKTRGRPKIKKAAESLDKKIQGEEAYLASCYIELINRIYDTAKTEKGEIIKLDLCEIGDPIQKIYSETLNRLKEEKIIENYELAQEHIEDKIYKPTEADIKYNFEFYAQEILEKNYEPPIEYEVAVALIRKREINLGKVIKLKTDKESVTRIEILSERNKFIVFINENFLSPIHPRSSVAESPYWRSIYALANGEEIPFNKNLLKYFNSRPDNPIYSHGFYKITKILERRNNLLSAVIKIKVLTRENVNRKLGQLHKKIG